MDKHSRFQKIETAEDRTYPQDLTQNRNSKSGALPQMVESSDSYPGPQTTCVEEGMSPHSSEEVISSTRLEA